MQFCPKCGSVLLKKRKNYSCSRCGYVVKEKIKLKSSEKMSEKKEIAVVRNQEESLPVTFEDCKKCGNKEAYFWTIQTRAGDEAETKFFKCTNPKCGFTWREYR